MADINPIISIITLIVNGLNNPIKKQGLAEWIKRHDLTMCCLQETYCIFFTEAKLTYSYISLGVSRPALDSKTQMGWK